MNASILSQGITTNTDKSVGTTLIDLLSKEDFHTFTGISAFASEAGIAILAPYMEAAKQKGIKLRLIVGVDQQATSKEALEAIMALGIESYVFYQTSYSIFHPKIYLFEGTQSANLIVGSSNLTQQGLFVSVEGSTHFELTTGQAADDKLIADLKAQFPGLYDLKDPNLQPITQDLIDKLVAEKVVPTEFERKAAKANVKEKEEEDAEGADAKAERFIPKLFPKRSLPKVPREYRPKKKVAVAPTSTALAQPAVTGSSAPIAAAPASYTLVWEMVDVPGSSVQISTSATTNPTGMMRLVQADYKVNGALIPSATYFRQVVFGSLPWLPVTPKTSIAIAKFEIKIPGKSLGEHSLKIRYKPSGTANQGNYTTGISWGTLGSTIKAANLAGKTVRLYRKDGTDDTFRLVFS